MVIINSYSIAVMLTAITMICWGSWANTQKLATKEWPFQLFYWDYSLGILLFSLVFGLTAGSIGEDGRSFVTDLMQGSWNSATRAFFGGCVFNIANLLLVAAIDIAGMAVAFPVGIGIALVLGVIVNFISESKGNPVLLFIGVSMVAIAIILNGLAYKKLSAKNKTGTPGKGIWISILAGILMAFFFRFVADSMSMDFKNPLEGKYTPYSALFVFSAGLFVSNFAFNTFFMKKPLKGNVVNYGEYFSKGTPKLHLIGLLGGIIWSMGMSFSLLASEQAGTAISYGLGQGATLVAALWGVFVWKEFKNASKFTNILLAIMFLLFMIGIFCIILARNG